MVRHPFLCFGFVLAAMIPVGIALQPPKLGTTTESVAAAEWKLHEARYAMAEHQINNDSREINDLIIEVGDSIDAFQKGLFNPETLKIAEAYRMSDGTVCLTYDYDHGIFAVARHEFAVYLDGKLLADQVDPTFGYSPLRTAWAQHCYDKTPVEDITVWMQ
jgi:hypothetical protein